MKKFTLFTLAIGFAIYSTFAQNNSLQFNVKAGAESIKIIYRLNAVGAKAKVNFGNNEESELEQTAGDKLEELDYTFSNVSTEDRVLSIASDNLVVLRIVSSKAVNQVISLASPTLETLNLDYTKLMESPKLDFSKCPNIKIITLNACDVEEVVLPEESKIEDFQISPALFSKKGLKELDFSRLKNLKTLGLNGVALSTVDLSQCPNLEKLVLQGISTKKYPTAILGAKKLKKLQFVNIQMCGVGYDMLPDLNDIEPNKFVVKKILSFPVPKDKIEDLTVDLSYLNNQKGISETIQKTSYKWKYYDNNTKKLLPLPKEKYTEKDGVFTFDPSILNADGTLKVRCYPFNPGYDAIEGFAFYYKSGYATKYITINAPKPMAELTITSDSPGKDEDGYDIEEIDITLHIGATKDTPIQIDWGYGAKDYTVKAGDPMKVSQEVDLGAVVKIYGKVNLLEASNCKIVAAKFNNAKSLSVLRISTNKIKTLDLSELPNLTELAITNNKIETIDLAPLTKLTELYCGYNEFTDLSVAANTKLTVLNCNNNKLKTIDVSKLSELEVFTPSDNEFPEVVDGKLDLSANTKLTMLDVSNCKLKELKLQANNMKRLVLYNNLFTTIPLELGKEYAHLYYLDIRKNNINACAINDVLFSLPVSPETFLTDKPTLYLKDNPGAKSYDKELLPLSGEKTLWLVDEAGDSSGCSTAKLINNSKAKEGLVTVMKEGEIIAFGTAIEKKTLLTIKVVPNEGYKLKEITINSNSLKENEKTEGNYPYTLLHNSKMNYTFEKVEAIEEALAKVFTIKMYDDKVLIEDLKAEGKSYILYNAQGLVLQKGIVKNQTIELTLEQKGVYILKVGKETLRLIK